MRYKNLKKLNNEISKLIIFRTNLENELKEIELSILKANHFNKIPPDTSKLKDENIIMFIEKKEKTSELIKNVNKKINELNSQINNIKNAVNEMPDCSFKTIMDLFFIKSESMEYITSATGYSRASIYNFIRMKGGEY